ACSPNRPSLIPLHRQPGVRKLVHIARLASAFPLALTLALASVTPAPAATPLAVLSAPAPAPDSTPRGPRIYKLPYPAGFTFTMCQGNNQGSHTANGQYAWDFCMPIGTPVTASR